MYLDEVSDAVHLSVLMALNRLHWIALRMDVFLSISCFKVRYIVNHQFLSVDHSRNTMLAMTFFRTLFEE